MKRLLITLLAGGLLAGAVYGAAASLGGLTTPSLGADDAVVASCDTDGVDVAYETSYSETERTYVVDAAIITGLDADCEGGTMAVTLSNAAGGFFAAEEGLIARDPGTGGLSFNAVFSVKPDFYEVGSLSTVVSLSTPAP